MRRLEGARHAAWTALGPAAAWRVGLLVAVSLALFACNAAAGHPRGLGHLASTLGLCVAGGGLWAWTDLEQRFRAAYRAEVLPLAMEASGWTWRADAPGLAALRRGLPRWDDARTTGALVGAHRGVAMTISAVQLTRDVRSEADEIVFHGLVVTVVLPGPSSAAMAARAAASVFKDGVLYLALHTGRDHFPAPGLLRPAGDIAALERLRADLAAVFGVVDAALGFGAG